jgi:DNA-binding CsgD family transcriptional regulator
MRLNAHLLLPISAICELVKAAPPASAHAQRRRAAVLLHKKSAHSQPSIDAAELHRLEREIVNVADREQQRIGNDLHDSIGQDLTGIALLLRCVLAQLKKENSHARPEVEDLVGLVNNVLRSTRELARGLLPVSAKLGALPAALQLLAARASMHLQIDIEFMDRCRSKLRLDTGAATHLYRIAQESLTYIMKHAAPEQLLLALRQVLNGGTYLAAALTTSLNAAPGARTGGVGLDPIHRLSNRELQVLSLIGRGQSSRVAAQALGLSVKTVETRRQTLKRKLNLATNGQLLQFAINWFTQRARSPAA